MILLCECNWEIPGLKKLPPHYHYVAGRLPGDKRWLPGLIDVNGKVAEQREFIDLHVEWDHATAEAFFAQHATPTPEPDKRPEPECPACDLPRGHDGPCIEPFPFPIPRATPTAERIPGVTASEVDEFLADIGKVTPTPEPGDG